MVDWWKHYIDLKRFGFRWFRRVFLLSLVCGVAFFGLLILPSENESVKIADSEEPINESKVRAEIYENVNEKRKSRDLDELRYNSKAAKKAEVHAEDMAQKEYFNHTSPTGQTQEERYAFCDGGENAYKTWVYQDVQTLFAGVQYYSNATELADGVVAGWMNSRPHRVRGIYGGWWTSAGVGVGISENNTAYAVMGFCT